MVFEDCSLPVADLDIIVSQRQTLTNVFPNNPLQQRVSKHSFAPTCFYFHLCVF